MAQLAMQQTMDEITDYLDTIDAKVDEVLRAQKDHVIAGKIGVDFVIEHATTVEGASHRPHRSSDAGLCAPAARCDR